MASSLLCGHATARTYYEEDEYRAFTGGLVMGLNFSQVDGDRYFGYHKPGIVAGAFVAMRFTDKIGLQTDLLFSQKGSHGAAVVESPFAGTSMSQCHIGLSYVELPVVLQYKWKRFTAEAGGSYSVLLRTNEWILDPQPFYIDKVANRFNTTDINYIFGAGGHLYKHWYANIRFQYSIVSIRPAERIPTGYGWGITGQFNNLFSIRFLYKL